MKRLVEGTASAGTNASDFRGLAGTERRPRRLGHLLGALGVALVLIALLAGCGGSSAGGTSYWKANFTNGTSQYISVVISGQNVSGWAQYGDGTFTHYDGQVNSDGTLDVTAYAGSTLSINGNSLTASLNGEGDVHFTKVAESAYKSAGGTE